MLVVHVYMYMYMYIYVYVCTVHIHVCMHVHETTLPSVNILYIYCTSCIKVQCICVNTTVCQG